MAGAQGASFVNRPEHPGSVVTGVPAPQTGPGPHHTLLQARTAFSPDT